MNTGRKQILSGIMALLFLVTLFIPGCSTVDNTANLPPATYEGSATVQVLLANDTTVLFDSVLWDIIQAFEKAHPNVEVEVQRLNEYKENFETWAELQEEIKAGNGPDIFILNTDDFPGLNHDKLLFPDVNKSMREGQFANLSMYYDYDVELDTAGLRQEVMDAGVVDGFRYTLPLTYDYPVMFVDKEKIRDAELDTDIFEDGIVSVMDAITELGDQTIAQSASFDEQRYIFNFFPDLVDYDTGHVLVEHDEITSFLNSFLNYRAFKGLNDGPDNNGPSSFNGLLYESVKPDTWMNQEICLRAGWSLGDIMVETALAEVNEIDLEVFSLTGPDGRIVAEINQYAAINYGVDNIPLAYEFVRELLTERGQWSQTDFRLSRRWNGDSNRIDTDLTGYPVRTNGSAKPLYDEIKMSFQNNTLVSDEVVDEIHGLTLSDKNIPILKEHIDVVRYPAAGMEWQFTMDVVREFEHGGAVTPRLWISMPRQRN